MFVSTGTSSGLRLYYPSSNDWWLDPSQGRFDLRVNGGATPLMTVLSGGNVGIGTSNPVDPFDLYVTGTNAYMQTKAVSGTYPAYAQYVNTGGSTYWGNDSSVGTGLQGTGGLPYNFGASGYGTQPFQITVGGAVRETILSGGNVGLGTTSPAAKLHVSSGLVTVDGTGAGLTVWGGSVTASAFFGDGSHLSGIGGSLSGGTANVVPVWTGASSLGIGGGYITNYSTGIAVQTNAFSVGGATLAVSGGNVGIGTSSPQYPLDIAGAAGNLRCNPSQGVSGEIPAGILLFSNSGPLTIAAGSAGASNKTEIAYFNGTQFYSALEVPQVASGFSNLSLMKSGGNVGIGTAGPQYRLHVSSGAMFDGNAPLRVVDTNGVGGYVLWGNGGSSIGTLTNSGSTVLIGAASNSDVGVLTNNGEKMRVTAGGNVGISTINPQGVLDVIGTDMYFGGLANSGKGVLRMVPYVNGANNDFWLQLWNNARGGTGNILHFSGYTGTNDTMDVDVFNGRVGIGTASPQYTLDVAGVVNSTVTGGSNFVAEKPTGAAYTFRRSGTDQVVLQESGAGDFQIYTNGGTLTEKMRVAANGSVGIGTAGPISLLDVKAATNEHFSILANLGGTGNLGVAAFNDATSAYVPMYLAANPFILAQGNVGIGTSSPATKLHFSSGTVTIDGTGTKVNIGPVQGGGYFALNVSGGVDLNGSNLYMNNGGSGSYLLNSAQLSLGWAGSGNITTANGSLTIAPAANAALLLQPTAGSVGVGTSNPAAKLHVSSGTLLLDGTGATANFASAAMVGGGLLRQLVSSSTAAQLANVTGPAVPHTSAIPTITEGFQVLSATITPLNAGSNIVVDADINWDESTNSTNYGVLCLFKNNATNAVYCASVNTAGSPTYGSTRMHYQEAAGGTTSINYSIRLGADAANSMGINETGGVAAYGGALISWLQIREMAGP